MPELLRCIESKVENNIFNSFLYIFIEKPPQTVSAWENNRPYQ